MATNPGRRIAAGILSSDRETMLTLQSLADYSPRNETLSASMLQQLAAALTQAEEAEVMARRTLEVAREQAAAAGLAFHTAVLGAKAEVVAQYGDDSPAVHAVGRKQKSERRRPTRRPFPTE